MKFSNFAKSRTTSEITPDGTTLSVEDINLFPDETFTAVLWDSSASSPMETEAREIVHLAKSGNNFTMIRAKEETTAKAFAAGSFVANVITAETMNNLSSASGSAGKLITSNSYEMPAGDTDTIFSFANDEGHKTVTLPESALCQKQSFTLINLSSKIDQRIRLKTSAGDQINNLTGDYLQVSAGAKISLTPIFNKWHITEYKMSPSVKKISDSIDLSVGDGTIYVDASAGNKYLEITKRGELAGVPLKIVKSDSTTNTVYVSDLDLPTSNRFKLDTPMESITVIEDIAGQRKVIQQNKPESYAVRITEDRQLTGGERIALVTTGNSDKIIVLADTSREGGKMITIKKMDSGSGSVKVEGYDLEDINGQETDTISGEGTSAVYAFDGTEWIRI